jgi:hypothetical protein
MNFRTAATPAQAGEMMRRAVAGQFLTRDETLAIYANEKNWRKEPHPGPRRGVMWVWQGPGICAPEAAQRVLDRDGIGY